MHEPVEAADAHGFSNPYLTMPKDPTGQCILNGYQFNVFGPDIGLGSVGKDNIV